MPKFFFHLVHDGAAVADRDGAELADEQAAEQHALQVAQELLVHNEIRKRHWAIDVRDEVGQPLLEIPFASIDHTIAHLPLDRRELIERTSRNRRELQKAVAETRRLLRQSRAARARAHGKPYLVTEGGSLI
ncbi:MAG TPA: hypothetical protein VHD34_02840 [Xanthobacteraceae bacterium]|nr:hypothetical protein [Xanthobacteraceae bacterium]